MIVCLRWVYHHIISAMLYIYNSWDSGIFVFIITVQAMICANDRMHYGLNVRSYSFVFTLHYFIVIIMQTYLRPFDISNTWFNLSNVCLALSQFPQLWRHHIHHTMHCDYNQNISRLSGAWWICTMGLLLLLWYHFTGKQCCITIVFESNVWYK